MQDLRIRVVGDAPDLKGFFGSTSNQVQSFVDRTKATYTQYYKNLLGLQSFPQFDEFGRNVKDASGKLLQQGSIVKQIRTEYDALENSIRTVATTGLELADGTFIPVAQTQQWLGEEKLVTAEMVKQSTLLNAQRALIATNRTEASNLRRAFAADRRAIDVAAKQVLIPQVISLQQQRFDVQQRRAELTEYIRGRQAVSGGFSGAARTAFDAQTASLIQWRNSLYGDQLNLTKQLNNLENTYNGTIAARNAIYNADRAALAARTAAQKASNAAEIEASRIREAALRVAPTTIPTGYTAIQQMSPQLLSQLQRAGLTQGTGRLGDVLRNQRMAEFNAPVKDLVRGVTHLSGSFVDNKGIMNKWSAELDSSGKLVTRFGGNLRGLSKIADQIGRDFQKVIEWAVATTVVFGSLRAAMAGLDVIKQLDADLTRFSVTSGLSKEATKEFYNELLNVAQLTATPIEELVKAADDLALAVRKPGQTIQQLTQDIGTLAEAIGVYTNLTGQDTVSATDQLVAVMKQLGYTASELYIVLNKVTAAAGGQSGAISDITKGLSVMAEAGKQAGLTIDQQIAVIKTLSQVTSKSPAEVATSFKNLVGALENPAAIKALSKLNIALVSQGSNIIQIYSDIARKIQLGAISGTEVSGLLRAISGGPRRAPDAAALLSNINTVLKETTVSANATNDAFLANAQIMTTLNAKIVQFQNTLKDKTFQQFGEVFSDLATVGIEAVTLLLQAFSQIPPALITASIETLALIGGFKLLVKIAGGIKATFLGIVSTVTATSTATNIYNGGLVLTARGEREVAAAASATNLKLRERLALLAAGKLGGIGRGAATIGIGAGLGLAAGGLTGQSLPQTIGMGLQGAGLAAFFVPHPLATAAGVVLTLAGTFLQLITNEEKASDVSEQTAAAILEAYSGAAAAARDIDALNKDLQTAVSSIGSLEAQKAGGEGWTAENQAALNDAYVQYADNLIASSNAQSQLNDQIERFKELEEDLPPGVERWGERLQAMLANPRGVPPEEFQKQLRDFQVAILEDTFPELKDLLKEGIPKFEIPDEFIEEFNQNLAQSLVSVTKPAGRPGLTIPGLGITPPKATFESYNIDEITSANVGKLFSRDAEGVLEFSAAMIKTHENIYAVRDAIADLGDTTEAAALLAAFEAWYTGADAIDTANVALKVYKKTAETLTGLYPETTAQLDRIFPQIDQYIQKGLQNVDKTEFANTLNFVFGEVGKSLETGQLIPNVKIREIAERLAKGMGLLEKLPQDSEAWNAVVDYIAENLLNWEPPIRNADDAIRALTDDSLALLAAVDRVTGEAIGSLAQRSLELKQKLADKEISKKDYAQEIKQLHRTAKEFDKFNTKIQDAANAMGEDFVEGFNQMKASLSELPGLEDAAYLSLDQFVGRMYDMAIGADYSGDRLNKFMGRVYKVINALIQIGKIRAKFTVYADLDTRAFVAKLRALAKIQAAAARTGRPPGISGAEWGAQIGPLGQNAANLNALANQLERYDRILRGFSTPSYAASGGGGGGGGSSRTRQGKDFSELDLPEELSGLANRNALIRQAIRMARELQRKIPGAQREAKNDVVTILDGMKKLETVRGVREDLLRRALEELAAIEKKKLETEANTIRRIRVGGGDFAAIANVPVNSRTGISVGGENQINITLNLNGTVLSPAQFAQFADQIAAALKRQLK